MKKINDINAQRNMELAVMAKGGNLNALHRLWECNKGFIHMKLHQMCAGKEEYLSRHGLTLQDLEQEMYFAVQAAVDSYDPDKGGFVTWLAWEMRRHLSKVVRGEHTKLVKTSEGRYTQISGNPLNCCTALDEPAPGFDEDENRLDYLSDPESETAFEEIDTAMENEYIVTTVRAAVDKLPDREKEVIIEHRLTVECKSLKEISTDLNISAGRVYQIERAAFQKLRSDRHMQKLRDEIIGSVYQGTSYSSWYHQRASIEERLIETKERKEEKWKAFCKEYNIPV